MLKIKNTEVYNLVSAIITSALPMLSKELTTEAKDKRIKALEAYLLDPTIEDEQAKKDLKRACSLGGTPSGSGHGNYLKGILVTFDVIYANYWTPQAQRYHYLEIISSSSKMHRLTKMDLTKACNKYVDYNVIENLNFWIDKYNNFETLQHEGKVTVRGNFYNKYELYMKIISNCPMGLEQEMGIATNYLQLKTIYEQRSNHKLKEDWGAWCAWCESLPHFMELTGLTRKYTNEKGELLDPMFDWR